MKKESKVELALGFVIVFAITTALLAPRFFLGGDAEPIHGDTTPSPRGEDAAARLSVDSRSIPPEETAEPVQELPAPEIAKTSLVDVPKPAESGSAVSADFTELVQEGQDLVSEGKLFEARPVLTRALAEAPEGAEREKVKSVLDALNARLLFSPMPTPDSKFHVVEPGESLWTLSQKYNTPVGLIKMVNNKSRDTLRTKERLKIMVGEWSGVVEKSKFRLTIFFNGDYAAEFPIGIGMHDKTPVGMFVIDSKEEDPTWYAPEGKVYPPDHEKNILGTRWLGFKETAEYHGYGIHGTRLPESIGKAESNGCIRLRNEDVEKVYCFLRKGDKVTIKP